MSAPSPRPELPPPDVYDPVIEVYKRDVDRTLLRENLKLTPAQRAEKFTAFLSQLEQLRGIAVPVIEQPTRGPQ